MSNIFEDAVDATLNGWTINGTSLKGITVPPHLIIWFKMTRPSLACIALQNKLLSPARGESWCGADLKLERVQRGEKVGEERI